MLENCGGRTVRLRLISSPVGVPFLGDLRMKRAVCSTLGILAAVVGMIVMEIPSAEAFPAFKVQFDKKYMVDGSALHSALEGKTNCNICHVGVDKKQRNDYGKALDKLLSKEDMQNAEKIQQVFEKTEAEKSGATTFGALIKEGKLPVTK